MFKRIFSSFALALTFASFLVPFNASAQASKSRLQKVQETGILRVGTTGDFMPMSFRDPGSNEFRGHQIDAANELAKDLGVKVEFVVTDWKSIMTAVQSDKFDIAMTGTSMSVARAKAAAFSTPWGRNAFFPLVLKKDAAKFKSWEALNNPKVTAAFNLGTTMEQFVQTNMPKVKVKRVESPARDFQELLAGKADFTVASLIEGAALMKQYPELQLVFLDKPKNSIPMAFLMAADDQQWLNFVNNWITIKKQNGYFTEINKLWGVLGQE
jgi:cyclohexadienyl dehydratase